MKLRYHIPVAFGRLLAICEEASTKVGVGVSPHTCDRPGCTWGESPTWDAESRTWLATSGTGTYTIVGPAPERWTGEAPRSVIIYDGAWRAFARHWLIPPELVRDMHDAEIVSGSRRWPDLPMHHRHPVVLALAYGAYPDDYPGEDGPPDVVAAQMRLTHAQRAREWEITLCAIETAIYPHTGAVPEDRSSWANWDIRPPMSRREAEAAA